MKNVAVLLMSLAVAGCAVQDRWWARESSVRSPGGYSSYTWMTPYLVDDGSRYGWTNAPSVDSHGSVVEILIPKGVTVGRIYDPLLRVHHHPVNCCCSVHAPSKSVLAPIREVRDGVTESRDSEPPAEPRVPKSIDGGSSQRRSKEWKRH